MAGNHISYFLIVIFLKQAKMYTFHFNLPQIQEVFNMKSHLKHDGVWKYCSNRDVCRSNNTIVCAVKIVNQKRFYKDFLNGCYLFLSNMCDHPEEEYFIVTGGSCEQYLASKRSDGDESESTTIESESTTVESESTTDESESTSVADYGEVRNDTNSTESMDSVNGTEKPAYRQGLSTLYEIDTAYDYHPCPYSCPNVYNPVCVNVNRGFGKFFKLLVFVNHCSSDLYYCKNWREFEPPPNEDESVRSSPLGWSFCGSSRYLAFDRFAEATSSMGHYGWLVGDYKYSHIMEPHQRLPGYG